MGSRGLWVWVVFWGVTSGAWAQTAPMPSGLGALEFGTPLEVFASTHDMSTMQLEQRFSFRVSAIHPEPLPGIAKATYVFDADGTQPLYEVIVTFDGRCGQDVGEALYGPPTDGAHGWRFTSPEGHTIRAWAFDSTLVVVAELPRTEWNEE